ncbi:SDR family oxidoreductase [Nocardia tengchongensis]|uniref:SDR family oxidoreductase n=1 Tax=Nocardia tengchongensis TaxID=2055889 RepID=A0ABX8CTI2_9NOCA|nr:SDR family oxidoreductase [Nocardia tengchongensis]QVI22857.1 SDR family oxidoreductase [Nocardia tengchongensis]
MSRFTDRSIIVTGAARGIGAAYAKALAAEGAKVVVADLNSELGEATAKEITADGGVAVFAPVDVADPESAKALAEFTVAEFGGINHLVNNAAIYGDMKLDLLVSVPWDYYKKFMGVNLDGALNVTRAVYKHIAKAGGGSIVNQSSTAAWTYSGFYGLAKAGINSLTQQLAHELGHSKIRVNAIAPGPTDTEATRSIVPEQFVDQLVKQMALKRLGTTEDMVGACLYLLSDDAAWVTGQVLNVDGGQVFRP